jgi:SAM-dependent methyltransferase
MAEYHKFVFDFENRSFVGQFEEMYQQEKVSNFDSWHQEDSRQLNRKIALSIMENYNFRSILDVGAGKGALTHCLKKNNNKVVGVDISSTAVEVAKSRFPDIDFYKVDVNNLFEFETFLRNNSLFQERVDLTFCSECLSYVKNWRGLIELISRFSDHLMISLYIPENPIGFIKSIKHLEDQMVNNFEIIESVYLNKAKFIILFGITKE